MAAHSYVIKVAKDVTNYYVQATKYTVTTPVETITIILDIAKPTLPIFDELTLNTTSSGITVVSKVDGLHYNGVEIPKGGTALTIVLKDFPLLPDITAFTLLNSDTPIPVTEEFDFYYRARYGAEFPWPESPSPEPVIEGEITKTKVHAEDVNSSSQNIEAALKNKVVDVVTYNSLIPGMEYTLVGKIYDLYSKAYLNIKDVETKFTAADVSGDTTITFEFCGLTKDGSDKEPDDDGNVDDGLPDNPYEDRTEYDEDNSLVGHNLVVILDMYGQDAEGQPDHWICSHDDLKDGDETIYVLKPKEPDPWHIDDDGGYPVVVDENFDVRGIVDMYESMIWTDRFDKAGDFEIYSKVDQNLLDTLKIDTYFYIKESDHFMIVEKITISSDPDEGDKLSITGRSLESLLDRRVIWNKTTINGNLQDGIHQLLNENVIQPHNDERRMANFIFQASSDPRITSLTMNAEYQGDNLYDTICDLCQTNHIGFRIILDSMNRFVFSLFAGTDRSYDNTDNNDYVIFGADYDNVVNSNYLKNKEGYKNVVRIAGSDDLNTSYNHTSFTGLSRRETFISATDIDPAEMEESSYKAALQQKGKDELVNYKNVESADGTMSTDRMTYLKEFGLGDIIEFKDHYGHELKTRISEVIISHSTKGHTIYPTFDVVEG